MKPTHLATRGPQTEQGTLVQTDRAGASLPDSPKGYSLVAETLTSVLATLVLGLIVSGLYPLLVLGLSQGLFHHKANGSLIVAADGTTVLGSELLGQNFGGKQYFNPRPSAAGAAGYDPTATGGTNLGPTSDKLINGQHKKDAAGNAVNDPSNFDGIKDLVAAYRSANGLKDTDAVPADAVTRSGSGMDPHISVGERAGPNPAGGPRAWQVGGRGAATRGPVHGRP